MDDGGMGDEDYMDYQPDGTPKNGIRVDGKEVTYQIEDSDDKALQSKANRLLDNEMSALEHRFNPKLQKLNNFNAPKDNGVVTVAWDTQTDSDDPKQRKRTALDALATWRKKILPNLDPGTVLHNSPADEQRARIYTLAGFADPDMENDQFGIVVLDRDGNKKVEPLGEVSQKASRITESYLPMLDLDLNTDEMELVYEVLLG